jgi:hypothetical protein
MADNDNSQYEDNQPSIKATAPGDRGGAISLTPEQMRMVAFAHGITSVRCSCGDVENCQDCFSTANTRYLAGRHLGYF